MTSVIQARSQNPSSEHRGSGALELMTNFFMFRTKSSLWLLAWRFRKVGTKVEAEVKGGQIITNVLEAVLTRAGQGSIRA